MKTFSELDLIEPLQRALADQDYATPTPIQAQTIPHALEGRDVLGCAQTGTGKTAAFTLPILNQLALQNSQAEPGCPLALVLAPTRELAIQIGESCGVYGQHLRLRHTLVYGGVSQHHQLRALSRGVHIVVATPGRLLDLMNQGHIRLGQLKSFVLDEADRMLDMGFLPDLKQIIRQLPKQRQSLFFSATLPPKIVELSQRLLHNPISVNVTPKSMSVAKIDQQVLFAERGEKLALLLDCLRSTKGIRALIFTRTKRGANRLTEQLARGGVRANAIHGNKSQNARQNALSAFRRNDVQVLVATDVAARGIDVDGITHVINFDLPDEPENYVHRIGRTGRAGATGTAISYCSSLERPLLSTIESLIKAKVPVGKQTVARPATTTPREPSVAHPEKSRRASDNLHKTPTRPKAVTGKASGRPTGKAKKTGEPHQGATAETTARKPATSRTSPPHVSATSADGQPRRKRKRQYSYGTRGAN